MQENSKQRWKREACLYPDETVMEEEAYETSAHARFFIDGVPHELPHNILGVRARGVVADPKPWP